jgi:hypothetical protein
LLGRAFEAEDESFPFIVAVGLEGDGGFGGTNAIRELASRTTVWEEVPAPVPKCLCTEDLILDPRFALAG